MADLCPACGTPLLQAVKKADPVLYDCPRCGGFALTQEADSDLEWLLGKYDDPEPRLSHAIRKMADRQQWPLITSELLDNILKHTQLPTPQEQLENLIVWLGDMQQRPGRRVRPHVDVISRIGAATYADIVFVVEHALNVSRLMHGVVNGDDHRLSDPSQLWLSFEGWERYEQLKRGHSSSRVAFMAMKFGDAELDTVFANCLVPAVAATGFELRRVDQKQPAGLIDDKLRVAIRQARFLLADLTHHNRGAYWEAGYAEGLGKPVIYMCRKDVFEDKTQGTHFDTNHHLTVIWEPERLHEAAVKLKDTIRATLPDEAISEA